jgi:hypothetical protein
MNEHLNGSALLAQVSLEGTLKARMEMHLWLFD